MRVTHSVLIEREPQAVWDFLSDYRNDPRFIDAVTSSSFVDAHGPAVGVRLKRSMRLPVVHKTANVDIEIVRYDPPDAIAFHAEEGPLSFVETRLVEAAGEGARVTFVLEGDPSGVLKLGERFMEKQTKKAMTNDLASLKRVLENDT